MPSHIPTTTRLSVAAVAVAALLTSITGCSGAGNTTCDQFAAQSFSDQGATARSLLSSHNLEKYDAGNTMGITNALNRFCGITGLGNEKASKNNSTPIDKAVDWSAKNW